MLNLSNLFKKKQPFDWYKMTLKERSDLAVKLGEDSSKIINKALNEARTLLEPYGYTMNIDLHFCELPKDKEKQAVGQKS